MADETPLCDALHIRPSDDLLDHTWEDCACLPFLIEQGDTFFFVHNAWDGRE